MTKIWLVKRRIRNETRRLVKNLLRNDTKKYILTYKGKFIEKLMFNQMPVWYADAFQFLLILWLFGNQTI